MHLHAAGGEPVGEKGRKVQEAPGTARASTLKGHPNTCRVAKAILSIVQTSHGSQNKPNQVAD